MDDQPNYTATQGLAGRRYCRKCGRLILLLVNGRLDTHQNTLGGLCSGSGEHADGRGPRGLPADG